MRGYAAFPARPGLLWNGNAGSLTGCSAGIPHACPLRETKRRYEAPGRSREGRISAPPESLSEKVCRLHRRLCGKALPPGILCAPCTAGRAALRSKAVRAGGSVPKRLSGSRAAAACMPCGKPDAGFDEASGSPARRPGLPVLCLFCRLPPQIIPVRPKTTGFLPRPPPVHDTDKKYS